MNGALKMGGLVAIVLVASALSPNASAKVTYRGDVPNGYVFDCATCHDDIPSLNWFGVDVALANGDDLGVDWQTVWWVDSDGDGITNGQELGDACGDWAGEGDPPITDEDGLSNPGDASSITGDPPDADCGDIGGPGVTDDAGAGDAGGCLYSALGRSRTPGGFALMAVSALLLIGRRRGGR